MKIGMRMRLLLAIGWAAAGAGCSGAVDESSSSGTTTETSTTSSATGSTTTSSTGVKAWEGPAECTEGQEPHLISGAVGEYLPWSAPRVDLALTAERVFYSADADPMHVAGGGLAIVSVLKGGGGAEVLGWISPSRAAMTAVAERLYYADEIVEYDEYDLGTDSTAMLYDVPVIGDAPPPIVDPHAYSGVGPVASNGTHVFWATRGEELFYVYRLPVGRGPAELEPLPDLAAEKLDGLAADEGALYFLTDGAIRRASPVDATAEELAITGVRAIAVDADKVYVARTEPCAMPACEPKGIIGYSPKGGDGDLTVLDEALSSIPLAIAVDGDDVYWLTWWLDGSVKATRIYKMPKTGGDKVQLAEGYAISSIALDETCLFWADRVDETVWKMHK